MSRIACGRDLTGALNAGARVVSRTKSHQVRQALLGDLRLRPGGKRDRAEVDWIQSLLAVPCRCRSIPPNP